MKKNTKKLLLFGLTSALLMTGCGGKDIVEIGGKQYLKEGDSYTDLEVETKTFLPGEHIIYYNVDVSNYVYSGNQNGWGNAIVNVPEIPEGYKYVNSFSIGRGASGVTSNIVYVFVNEVPVEATSKYNRETGEFGFFEPGRPVKQLMLD
jgi:hypothetical protein